jgi:hypothetical protein
MFEAHPLIGIRSVDSPAEREELPQRTPQQAREELEAKHAAQLQERPPDMFRVADAPQKWRHLHRVLTREEPQT